MEKFTTIVITMRGINCYQYLGEGKFQHDKLQNLLIHPLAVCWRTNLNADINTVENMNFIFFSNFGERINWNFPPPLQQ